MKERLDALLVSRGLAPSREQAQRLIRAGKVSLDSGQVLSKPGQQIDSELQLNLQSPPPFVSRGGEKLVAAMRHWPIDLTNKVCADIGASTGGFTDCMLQRGARRVYAVDVGHGQLNYGLRQDERVVVMDKTNARHLPPDVFDPRPAFASFDVSFISLTKVLPAVVATMTDEAELVTLIKPQFEAGKDQVGKGGVVRDPDVHESVCDRIMRFGTETLNLEWLGRITSPIKGPAGNIEFLAYWKKI